MAAVRRAGTVGRGRVAMPDRRAASGAGRGGHPNGLFGAALVDRLRLVLLRYLPRRGDVDRRAADRGERPVHRLARASPAYRTPKGQCSDKRSANAPPWKRPEKRRGGKK